MNIEQNPYSPPTEISTDPPQTAGVWRYDNSLFISHDAELPLQWCVKTNQPTTDSVDIWLWRGSIAAPSRSLLFSLGLNDSMARGRRLRKQFGVGGVIFVVAGLVLIVMRLAIITSLFQDTSGDPPYEPVALFRIELLTLLFVCFFQLVVILIAAGCLIFNFLQIFVWKVTTTHVFLYGVHPDFLERFPDWPRG